MISARRLPTTPPPPIVTDPGIVEGYLADASVGEPGRACGVARPSSEAEAASLVEATRGPGLRLLPQAARTSLTGGAVPRGELVVSVERLIEIGPAIRHPAGARVTVGAGVRLRELERQLAGQALYFPPVPTYQEAMIGGTVSTNAGGAASFKYGATRQWVHGLRVVLFNGDVLEIERGCEVARRGECFRIGLSDGAELRVPVPGWRLPQLRKISAGYHAADPLDLVDLFVGSEGTLGLITSVTLEVTPLPPAVVTGLAFLPDEPAGLALAAELRGASRTCRDDDRAPDLRALEWIDGRGLELLRAHGDAARLRVALPSAAGAAVLFEVESSEPLAAEALQARLACLMEGRPVADGPWVRLFRLLARHRALDDLDLAFPGDESRRAALSEFREAVPLRVGEILTERRRQDPGVHKVGGDLIVPFDHVGEMLALYRLGFERRGLDYAVWGHLSDGNLHPNAIPRSADEARRGVEALREFAEEAVRRGGCPLSEHGVGRSPVKQDLLERFLGSEAMAQMRRIKHALDPEGRFSPGVLFPEAS